MTPTDPPADVTDLPAIRPFTEWLAEHRDGELNVEVSEALHDLIRRVQMTGRAGQLALVLTVKGAGDMVAVTDDVTIKPPKTDREVKSYFVDGEGNLTRANPHQPELPGLRTVPPRAPAATAREVRA